MFKPSKVHHSHCKESCSRYVAQSFSLLSWNIYKKNRTSHIFADYLQTTFPDIDFMLLQEAQIDPTKGCVLNNFAFEAAANLEVGKNYYGVITAGRIHVQESKAFLSTEREMYVGTHKSLLLSKYCFEDGTELLLVNIHAINFRENSAFEREKERLLNFLASYEGALVVAGDFNTWNNRRAEKLDNIGTKLGLKQVPFSKEVKSILGNPIDFIFYRGLKLEKSRVDDDHGISDHHPLFAKFKKI